jgi:hypothetical protein
MILRLFPLFWVAFPAPPLARSFCSPDFPDDRLFPVFLLPELPLAPRRSADLKFGKQKTFFILPRFIRLTNSGYYWVSTFKSTL